MQTGQFGNMLLLDDDPNLADSDKSYTEVCSQKVPRQKSTTS